MKNFVITADSNSDLPSDFILENQIGIIPHYYDLEGTTYGDELNLTPEDFYNKMRDGLMPTTMASNPEVIRKIFQSYLDQDLDILHISFSSSLSGGCSNVVTTSMELLEEYPHRKILVLDTLNASLGEGLFIMKAVELKKEGCSLDEIYQWLEDHKMDFCVRFTVNDLNHLYRGGRISKTTAFIGTMINVKPILYVNAEGHLVPHSTSRGRKKSLNTIFQDMIASMGKYKDTNDPICIAHGDSLEDALHLADLVKAELPHKAVVINFISPSIGAHSGPGAIGLCFLGENR